MPLSRAHPARRSRRLAAGVILSALLAAHAHSGQALRAPGARPGAAPGASTTPVDPDSLPSRLRAAFDTLGDSEAAEPARLEAARALINTTSDSARALVIATLASTNADDQRPALLLRALAETFQPALRPALLGGARPDSSWPEARRASAIRALALDQSRDTVAALIDRLTPAEAPAVRAAATAALIRITGRDDDEPRRRGSRDAWNAWFQTRALYPENLWLAELATGCAARAERLAAARRDVESQYRAAMEQLYNASDADQRHNMLLDMLQEPLIAIRQLGLDLIERALDGSQRISPDIARRLIELLADPAPDIRGRAALLIDRMRPEGAGAAVAEALLREKDPEVAGRLLLALRNWPTPVTRDVALRWLAFDDPLVRRHAARAILAAVEAGVLRRPEDHQAIVATLRAPAPETLSGEGMQLLARLGDTGDRELLAALLTGPDASARRLAAIALADRPDDRPRLLEAAAKDSQLLPILVEAIAANDPPPTLADYDAIAQIIPPDGRREDHLAAIAARLPLTDLIEVGLRDIRARAEAVEAGRETAASTGHDPDAAPPAPAPPSAAYTERILAPCLDTARSINGAQPEQAPALARALLLLAEIRLSLDRPDTALDALDAIHPAWEPQLTPEITHTRAVTLLLLGRLDDPHLASATPNAWLDALDRCARRKLPHTRDLHAATLALAGTFTASQRERFDQIAAAIPPPQPPPGEQEPESPVPTPPEGGG